MAIKITSTSNEIIKNIYKKSRENNGSIIIIESEKIILEALELNVPLKNVFCTQEWYDTNKSWASKMSSIIIVSSIEVINKLAFTKNPPNVIATSSYEIPTFKIKEKNKYLILENIKDPGNLATIIRSCIAFNIKEIFITKDCVNPYNEKVIRSSMGAIFSIKINIVENIIETIKELQTNGIDVYASCIDLKSIELEKLENKNGVAIILGNEANGISDNAIKYSSNKIHIKIENIDSLNVASAAAIFLYKLSSK